jgi:folate-binding protein YgfZ
LPDNLPTAAGSFSALPDHALVVLEGPDAVAFAQAQFANDVAALATGHWQWNAWLTPKGRVIAVFALLKPSQDRLLLLVPDMAADALVTPLQRFVFRRKLKISAGMELSVSGSFQRPVSAESARIGLIDDAIELDYGDEEQPRTVRISSHDQPEDAQALMRWFAQDLKTGLPRLPDAQREQWTPQQLSLERLHAFSVKKGCYPGQEIVARTHFLGKAKRGLVLFNAETPLLAGMDIYSPGQTLGKIVSVTIAQPFLGLAVLPRERGSEALTASGVALREIQLIDGLQR